jgi:NADPH-dependent curcumin reductase CurA
MTGMTAWAGLNLVKVKAGDVIYISGAAGAVGNVAGQLAKNTRLQSYWLRRFHGESEISA